MPLEELGRNINQVNLSQLNSILLKGNTNIAAIPLC